MKSIFDTESLSVRIQELRESPLKYYIGIDSYSDDNESSYCLGYKIEDKFVIVLAKTERNKKIFIEEVNNLMKYFNAVKIEERGKRKNS